MRGLPTLGSRRQFLSSAVGLRLAKSLKNENGIRSRPLRHGVIMNNTCLAIPTHVSQGVCRSTSLYRCKG